MAQERLLDIKQSKYSHQRTLIPDNVSLIISSIRAKYKNYSILEFDKMNSNQSLIKLNVK